MRVVVTRAFGVYSKGHVIPEMPGGMAREYIRRGFVAAEVSAAPAPGLLDRAVAAVRPAPRPAKRAG